MGNGSGNGHLCCWDVALNKAERTALWGQNRGLFNLAACLQYTSETATRWRKSKSHSKKDRALLSSVDCTSNQHLKYPAEINQQNQLWHLDFASGNLFQSCSRLQQSSRSRLTPPASSLTYRRGRWKKNGTSSQERLSSTEVDAKC